MMIKYHFRYTETTCAPVPFRDRPSKRRLRGKVALVVEVHPGSYKIGPPSAAQGEGLHGRLTKGLTRL